MNKAAPPPTKPAPGKAAKSDGAAAAEKHTDGGISIIALILITVIGAGVGGAFGTMIPPLPQADVDHKLAEQAKPANEMMVVPMAPITTNLQSSGRTWIRIEASALVHADVADKAPALVAKVSEDIVSYLRTVSMEQLEGPSGFQHLTEDLNDRARLRSEGKVVEVLVQALIIE